ncbi:peptidoglycan-binding domain-containing protein [Streptomyces flaveus]|uniref:Peptidoglycan-binding protein n=1 Tax=Streptomyces flaveus TaxID=66370 RepID=A0A917QK05_9ACTN|nr:peptidoglycan-binding protein [Streptomyces flaveus]GGK54265.1 peptidoglycan-binding protein [Streptomyces flaveus]
MSDRSVHVCPECGTPREPGGAPSCACAQRAADELLETRYAETAAAEDFDPLRIRPYVDLEAIEVEVDAEEGSAAGAWAGSGSGASSGSGAGSGMGPPESLSEPGSSAAGDVLDGAGASRAADPLVEHTSSGAADPFVEHNSPASGDPLVEPGEPGPPAAPPWPSETPAGQHSPEPLAGEQWSEPPSVPSSPPAAQAPTSGGQAPTSRGRVPSSGTQVPSSAAQGASAAAQAPSAYDAPTTDLHLTDLHRFGAQAPGPDPVTGPLPLPEPEQPARRGGRRRRLAFVGTAVGVVVMTAAGFASGLFSYDTPSRDSAGPPGDMRASIPDAVSPEPPSPSPSKTTPPAQPPPSTPPTEPSEPATPSTSPPTQEPTDRTTPPRETPSTRPPSTKPPADSAPPDSGGGGERSNQQVLRPGDSGDDVTELQLRLRQLFLYAGPTTGTYDDQTENSVRSFQGSRNVDDELGIYGEPTRESLESETDEP